MSTLRGSFLLDPDVVFLNHGSFGATPRPVFDAWQAWQRRMEAQPVLFLGRELPGLLAEARAALGGLLGAQRDDLAFLHNATLGVNVVARSLAAHLRPGDEILTTDHEYGACINAWEMVCRTTGALLVRQPIPMPDERPDPLPGRVDAPDPISNLQSPITDLLWAGVTERTRVIFLSHVTSPTALRLSVAEIGRRAQAAGILTLVDGAHAPGQIDLDLPALGVDFYTGNLHKWLCAPKGAGFLWARRAVQGLIEPLVVSWGWGPERNMFTGSDFVDALEWQGTDDFSACLAVPAAIAFQRSHGWDAVRADCREKLARTLARMEEVTGMPSAYLAEGISGKDSAATCAALLGAEALPPQVGVIPLPQGVDALALKARLWERHRIEIPAVQWRGRSFLRLSVQGYVTDDDLNRFAGALREELK